MVIKAGNLYFSKDFLILMMNGSEIWERIGRNFWDLWGKFEIMPENGGNCGFFDGGFVMGGCVKNADIWGDSELLR